MGALDVCPFIPVQNVTMEDCVECAKEFGDKLSIELGVPGKILEWQCYNDRIHLKLYVINCLP